MKRISRMVLFLAAASVMAPDRAEAMHISDGIIPLPMAGLWFLLVAPFIFAGLRKIKEMGEESVRMKPLIGLTGAAVFIISCMPVPIPIAGVTAHPCGMGLAAIMVGPWIAVVIASVALLMQALFLAHGGLTTLGANTLSMGVLGAFGGYLVFRLGMGMGAGWRVSAFMAGLLADWATYAGTAFILALALAEDGSFFKTFIAIVIAFAPTQIPLGILEGFITAGAYGFIKRRRPEILTLFRMEKPA